MELQVNCKKIYELKWRLLLLCVACALISIANYCLTKPIWITTINIKINPPIKLNEELSEVRKLKSSITQRIDKIVEKILHNNEFIYEMVAKVHRPDLYQKYLPKAQLGGGYIELLTKGDTELWINLRTDSEDLSLLMANYIIEETKNEVQKMSNPVYEFIDKKIVKLDDRINELNLFSMKFQPIIAAKLSGGLSSMGVAVDALTYYQIDYNVEKISTEYQIERIALNDLSADLKNSVRKIVFTPLLISPSIKKSTAFGAAVLIVSILAYLIYFGGIQIRSKEKND